MNEIPIRVNDRQKIAIRLLYTIFFMIVLEMYKTILFIATLFQYVYLLLTRTYSLPVCNFSNILSSYTYHVMRYITLNDNQRPFPFTEFQDDILPSSNTPDFGQKSISSAITDPDRVLKKEVGSMSASQYTGSKEEALKLLEEARNRYNNLVQSVKQRAVELYELRRKTSEQLIASVEAYVNRLANSPKELDKSFSEYVAEYKEFNSIVNKLKAEEIKAGVQAGSAVGAGVAAGVGVAAFGPTAAMAIATTFGTASTGTAIASLSGAAATNAALAWLGGGALTAGGGGMTAGSAFLALAGPIGWIIGGLGLLTGFTLLTNRNTKIVEAAYRHLKEIETGIAELSACEIEMEALITQTNMHVGGVKKFLILLQRQATEDYRDFTGDQKDMLAALINHIRSLSKLLNKKVQ